MSSSTLPSYEPLVFPYEYRYRVDSVSDDGKLIKVFVALNNISDCDDWIAKFARLTSTSWNVRTCSKNKKNLVSRKTYICHHSSYRKCAVYKKSKPDLKCKAQIRIVIKNVNRQSKNKHRHIQENLPTVVVIENHHTHSITGMETLGYLKPLDSVKNEFSNYFDNNLLPMEAYIHHKSIMELRNLDEAELANGALCPKYRTVKNWYSIWKHLNFGTINVTGAALIEKLNEKANEYEEMGVIIRTCVEPFSVLVITPLMRRAHDLTCSQDVVFVNSSSSSGKQRHSITFVLTMKVGGAVPLALLITDGQTTEDYTSVFTLLKEATREFGFGGMGSPRYFITDDSDAERISLGNVFPNAKLLLCIFHVGQSIWRWLCDSKHGISKSDRTNLFNLFKNIYSAKSKKQAEEEFSVMNENTTALRYSSWVKYMSHYWGKKECWCLAYRDNQINKYAEITVRIYQDIVLQRYKSYNALSLVHSICTDLEKYYQGKYADYADGRIDKKKLHLQFEFDKIKYLKKELIIRIDEHNYQVPSESIVGKMYDVSLSLGRCTCDLGNFGNVCKHQSGVYCLYLNISNDDTLEEKYSWGILALGNNVSEKEFCLPLGSIETKFEFFDIVNGIDSIENENDDSNKESNLIEEDEDCNIIDKKRILNECLWSFGDKLLKDVPMRLWIRMFDHFNTLTPAQTREWMINALKTVDRVHHPSATNR